MKRCKLLTTLAQSNATDSNSCLRHIDGICRINWRACGTAEALRNAVGVRADRARQAIAVDVVVSHGSGSSGQQIQQLLQGRVGGGNEGAVALAGQVHILTVPTIRAAKSATTLLYRRFASIAR